MLTCDYCARTLPESQFTSGKRCKLCRYLAEYKVNHREYQEMLDRQSGRCAICQHQPNGEFPDILCIDHDHQWANRIVVRGLLCHACNRGLGCFVDNPVVLVRAMQYLERKGEFYGRQISHTRFSINATPNWRQIIDDAATPTLRQQELADRFGAHLFQPPTLGLAMMVTSVFGMWESRRVPDEALLQTIREQL